MKKLLVSAVLVALVLGCGSKKAAPAEQQAPAEETTEMTTEDTTSTDEAAPAEETTEAAPADAPAAE